MDSHFEPSTGNTADAPQSISAAPSTLMTRRARFFSRTRAADAAESLRRDAPDALAETLLADVGHRLRAAAEAQGIRLTDSQLALGIGHARQQMIHFGAAGVAHLASNSDIIRASLQAALTQLSAGQITAMSGASASVSTTRGAFADTAKADASGFPASLAARMANRAYRDLDAGSEAAGSVSISASYLKAYAGIGYDAATVKTFAEVGLNRSIYDDLRQQGFDKPVIARTARGVKALGFKGKEAIVDGATIEDKDAGWLEDKAKPFQSDLKAEKDPAKREQIEQKFFNNEVLPEPDRAAREAKGRFWERITGKTLELGQKLQIENGVEQGREAARDSRVDQIARARSNSASEKKAIDDTQAKAVETSDAALANAFESSLGSKPATVAPVEKQASPEPVKGAQPAPAGNQKTAEAKLATVKPPAPKV